MSDEVITDVMDEAIHQLQSKKEGRMQEAIAETDWSKTHTVDVFFVMDNDGYEMKYSVRVDRFSSPQPPRTFPHRPYEHYRFTESELREVGVDPETGEYKR